MEQTVNWKIGGQAGYGIMTAGLIFAKTVLRHGWNVFCYPEYPSLIRGGHNTYQVHAVKSEAACQRQQIEVLVALDERTVSENQGELTEGGVLIYDPEKVKFRISNFEFRILELPMISISKEICGSDLMKDTVALGASLALYQGDLEILNSVIKDVFKDKSQEMIEQNLAAAKRGYEFINKISNFEFRISNLSKIKASERILVTGNEAVGLGALAAGCKFYVAYPMTPATSILHFLAKHERNYDLMVKQAEDEIAVINMAIGASFTGVRACCATSGGGFALMNESLAFAGIAEIPLVIVEAQRPGPATGLPTWTAQGDLAYAINAGHGEFLRVVMAPGDATEAYKATINAFNLADKYQLPVIILSDKYLAESFQSTEVFNTEDIKIERGQILSQAELDKIQDFKRYQFAESGISPRSLPGQAGGAYQANSDEHDEYGYSSEEADNRTKMADKRWRKLSSLAKELPEPKIYGNPKASQTIICWGSTKTPVLEALKDLADVRVVHLQYLYPFPIGFFQKNIKPEQSMVIEGNQTGQLRQLIRQQTGLEIKDVLLKYDGRPFYPEEIINKLKAQS